MNSTKKVAVITGAASGIGLALTAVCLDHGMRVVMADKNDEALAHSFKNLSLSFDSSCITMLTCDVSKAEDLSVLAHHSMQHFSRVDWLFNNAGICGQVLPFWQLSIEDIRQVMDVNLYGVVHGIQAFLPILFAQKHRSHIINMASFYGLCSASKLASYTMSKHAIVALSESLYFDLQSTDKPVDVSVVCPSFVNTALLSCTKHDKNEENNALQSMLADFLARSRPAEELAAYIVQAVLKGMFYILPDKEVHVYCQQRIDAIREQQMPAKHNIEKLMTALYKRISS